MLGARILYGLAYRPAKITRSLSQRAISYQSSTNLLFKKVPARLDAQLDESVGITKIAREPLDRFLLERYRFWARRKIGVRSSSAQIRHLPYDAVRLGRAEYKGGLFNAFGLPEPQDSPAVTHFCQRVFSGSFRPAMALQHGRPGEPKVSEIMEPVNAVNLSFLKFLKIGGLMTTQHGIFNQFPEIMILQSHACGIQ